MPDAQWWWSAAFNLVFWGVVGLLVWRYVRRRRGRRQPVAPVGAQTPFSGPFPPAGGLADLETATGLLEGRLAALEGRVAQAERRLGEPITVTLDAEDVETIQQARDLAERVGRLERSLTLDETDLHRLTGNEGS